MNFEGGLRFLVFLVIFGFTNYLMMLGRYEKDYRKRKTIQKNKVSSLYPKGTLIRI